MTIWLVDDDEFKRRRIRALLEQVCAGARIDEARSANSALKLVVAGLPDLVVLDMSLPTFDIGPREAGGRPQGFGGEELLREMDRREMRAPVIVVTQYAVFESGAERMGVDELDRRLRRDHPETFAGMIRYEDSSDEWRHDLQRAIASVVAGVQSC